MTRFFHNDDFELVEKSGLSIRYIIAKEDQIDKKIYYEVTYEEDGHNFTRGYMGWAIYSEEKLPEEEREFYKFQELIKGKYPWNYFRIMTNCDGTVKVVIKRKGENTKTIMSASGNRTDVLKQLGIE